MGLRLRGGRHAAKGPAAPGARRWPV